MFPACIQDRVALTNDRATSHDLRTESGGWGGAKGGELQIEKPSQHVLSRTSVIVTSSHIEVRFTVAMPGKEHMQYIDT